MRGPGKTLVTVCHGYSETLKGRRIAVFISSFNVEPTTEKAIRDVEGEPSGRLLGPIIQALSSFRQPHDRVRLLNMLFKSDLKDIMSGYGDFNADFLKKVSVPYRRRAGGPIQN